MRTRGVGVRRPAAERVGRRNAGDERHGAQGVHLHLRRLQEGDGRVYPGAAACSPWPPRCYHDAAAHGRAESPSSSTDIAVPCLLALSVSCSTLWFCLLFLRVSASLLFHKREFTCSRPPRVLSLLLSFSPSPVRGSTTRASSRVSSTASTSTTTPSQARARRKMHRRPSSYDRPSARPSSYDRPSQ
eukprot:6182062-Pleurochrysis_carterae.AAC.4